MTIANREIITLTCSDQSDWRARLPRSNWLCVVAAENDDRRLLDEVIDALIDNDVCYICTIGSQAERIHDLIDEEIVNREVMHGKKHLPPHTITTTWHEQPEEGIWFATHAAFHEVPIERIVILEMSHGAETGGIDPMNKYEETFETWNNIASLYQDKFMGLDLYNETYDFICNTIDKPHAKVLEIGCGPGNITKYLLSKRPDFDIFGIDIAPNMVELARQNNPKSDTESDVHTILIVKKK
ncbi:MAG: class I SAM-dependent methyltransferase [Flavobacteriales bacterium]